jgi:hypothetical protein
VNAGKTSANSCSQRQLPGHLDDIAHEAGEATLFASAIGEEKRQVRGNRGCSKASAPGMG